jgi:hypothetical protein
MKPLLRPKVWLAVPLALLGASLLLAEAHAQRFGRAFRPVIRSPVRPGPVFRPPVSRPTTPIVRPRVVVVPAAPVATQVWKCPTCGRQVGSGPTPPASVTCCGQTYINGKSLGFGPAAAAPVMPPVFNPPAPTTSSSTGSFASGGLTSSSGWSIAVSIGIVLAGAVVLIGAALMVVYGQVGPEKSRRRPAESDDFEDDDRNDRPRIRRS